MRHEGSTGELGKCDDHGREHGTREGRMDSGNPSGSGNHLGVQYGGNEVNYPWAIWV